MKKLSFILFCSVSILLLCSGYDYALTVADFADFNFSKIKYTDRVALSSNIDDFDFEADGSDDSNGDGKIDILEENTFTITGEGPFKFFIGNKSSRYNLRDILLWIGTDGKLSSFTLNGTSISLPSAFTANDQGIYWPSPEMKEYIDSVFLIDMEEGLGKRGSIRLPVSTSDPMEVILDDIAAAEGARVYITAIGSIKSGFNSIAGPNSDILILKQDSAPIPEPVTFSIAVIGIAISGLKLRSAGKR